jgi:hypothetical protein
MSDAFASDREAVERFRNVDYRAGYLESHLRGMLNTMRGARAALSTGARHKFARDILDRDIAGAERTLRLCKEAIE